MRRKRISMDKIREILRLHKELNLGCRKIAAALNISKTAVSQYISEFRACKLDYESIYNLCDSELLELLSSKKKKCKKYETLELYFCYFAKELKRRGACSKDFMAGIYKRQPRWIQLCKNYMALQSMETGK